MSSQVGRPSVRQRRRAETVREITEAGLRQVASSGASGLSLRAVAREVGMSVQALSYYFPSRDELLTTLTADAHDDLARCVQAQADATRGGPRVRRRLAVAEAYRDWAHAHRSAFLLIYGADGQTRREGRAGEAAWRLALPFADVVFDGWSPAALAALPAPADLRIDPPQAQPPLPWGAMVLLTELRALMHGLVMLELFDYYPLDQHGAAIFTAAMQRVSDDLDARQEAALPLVQANPDTETQADDVPGHHT